MKNQQEIELPNADFILPFIVGQKAVHGKFINLSSSITKAINAHYYPQPIAKILSELIAIVSLLGSNLKAEGIVTAEIHTKDSILRLVVADYVYGGDVRGYAELDEQAFSHLSSYKFADLISSGYIMITTDVNGKRYQGIVELDHYGISSSIMKYFSESQQIAASFNIMSKYENILDEITWQVAGVMVQKLPETKEFHSEDKDIFETYHHFIQSITVKEMFSNPKETLYKLFHEDGIWLYPTLNIKYKCRCSKEKMEKALVVIPENELENYAVNGMIAVKCQFCNTEYNFPR